MKELDHLLAEIKDNIIQKDAIKARLVLAHLEHVDKKTGEQVVAALHQASPDFAVPLLARFLVDHKNLANKLPLVREILAAKILIEPVLVSQALRDPQTPHRHIYISMAGELRLEALVPDLMQALLAASDVDEINQYIQVLGEIGDPAATNILSDFLYSGNRTLTISAIKALGKLGSPTAIMRLSERMGTDSQLDILVLDIFARVQDSISLEKLNDAIRSHYAHLRTYAKKALTNIGLKAVPILTQNLLFNDPDLQIHTLNILGDIGDPAATDPIRKLLHNQPKNPNVRFAAYEALGMLPLGKGAYTLTFGLTDSEEHVCIAAAKAIDRNFNEILAAGIKNIAADCDEDAHRIIKTVINAQAKQIFLSLVQDSRFQDIALTYLVRAHQDIKDFFCTFLKEEDCSGLYLELLDSDTDTARVPESIRKRVCAVDDSRMILNIYKTTLHELGLEPVLFEFPASALEWLNTERPDIVITDLNMPDLTGIDLTREIRKKFTKEELPVLMITTQNEITDNKAAFDAGVSEILHKPFTAHSLQEAMAKYI